MSYFYLDHAFTERYYSFFRAVMRSQLTHSNCDLLGTGETHRDPVSRDAALCSSALTPLKITILVSNGNTTIKRVKKWMPWTTLRSFFTMKQRVLSSITCAIINIPTLFRYYYYTILLMWQLVMQKNTFFWLRVFFLLKKRFFRFFFLFLKLICLLKKIL